MLAGILVTVGRSAAEPVSSYTTSGSTTVEIAVPTIDTPSAAAHRTNLGSARSDPAAIAVIVSSEP